jgi:hypothetical protein
MTTLKTLTWMIAAAVLATAPAAAHAAVETFTFKTTGTTIDAVRVPATGAAFQGVAMNNTKAEVTYADGRKETVTAKCAAWRNPPNAQFSQSGVCVSRDYEQNYSCQPRDGKAGVNCWGLLRGTNGAYKGRTGLIAYTNGPEGLEGLGRWGD